MTDFVEALESELRRAAERRARGRGRLWRSWRPARLLPAAAVAIALGIGLAVVFAVRPAGEHAGRPARPAVTGRKGAAPADRPPAPPAGTIPADVSPGARHSKRFGRGERLAVSAGVPVFADVDRWRYCPAAALPLREADVPAATAAVVAIVADVVPKDGSQDPTGARGQGTLVTGDDYAIHQCGTAMRNHSVDVFVTLPRVTFSASLAQLDLVVARTQDGWVVFDRRH